MNTFTWPDLDAKLQTQDLNMRDNELPIVKGFSKILAARKSYDSINYDSSNLLPVDTYSLLILKVLKENFKTSISSLYDTSF